MSCPVRTERLLEEQKTLRLDAAYTKVSHHWSSLKVYFHEESIGIGGLQGSDAQEGVSQEIEFLEEVNRRNSLADSVLCTVQAWLAREGWRSR